MKIPIVGTGTIGQPLIKLFLTVGKALGIDEVIFHKNYMVKVKENLFQRPFLFDEV